MSCCQGAKQAILERFQASITTFCVFLLIQVLANYLSNAAKFTPRGGKVCLRVSATCSVEASSAVTENVVMDVSSLHSQGEVNVTKGVDGGPQPPDALKEFKVPTTVAKVTLSVEDTGIGISEEDQKRLFEPYMQVHATSSQAGGGTGLGLCFSKRSVRDPRRRLQVYVCLCIHSIWWLVESGHMNCVVCG